MRYFVTGASGWIGTATTRELLTAGHQVVGLARSDASADHLRHWGAEVVRGDLESLDVLAAAAADSDGVAHLAFRHDLAFSGDFEGAVAHDRAAIEAMAGALDGSGRPLLVASGTLIGSGAGEPLLETVPSSVSDHARAGSATYVEGLGERGIRGIVVRYSPTVHGEGDSGFVAVLSQLAQQAGEASYVDDGSARWPAVHRDDAARLNVVALERAEAGAVLHAVAEEAVPTRAIAEAIGRSLDLPARSVPRAEAHDRLGFLGEFFGLDAPAGSDLTRQRLDWHPSGPTLLEDIEAGHYARD